MGSHAGAATGLRAVLVSRDRINTCENICILIYPYLRLGGWKAGLARRGAAKAEGRPGGHIYDKYTNITQTSHNKHALVVYKK